MSNVLVPFAFEGIQVRVIKDEKGEPWFVARDVCAILGYVNTRDAVERHCKHPKLLKGSETRLLELPPRGMNIIPESDLYRLIMRSNMSYAERFQVWVTETVLPTIRKHGGYIVKEEKMDEKQKVIEVQTGIMSSQIVYQVS